MKVNYSRAERSAIDVHKYFMSQKAKYDVGLEVAIRDWEKHHGPKWRRQCQADMLAEQSVEIRRHTWIESEKACCDLGTQAKLDWINNYAAQWRKWYDHEHGGNY